MVALVIVLAVAGLIWKIAAKAQTPKRRVSDATPQAPYEEITIPSHGHRLTGWFIPSKHGANQPTVIVAHGWNSSRFRVLRYTAPLIEAGYAVLMYDARSHGDSDAMNAPSGLSFRDDVIAAVAYARSRPDVDPNRIALLGHSLGAFGSVLALLQAAPVRAIVTDSMPVHMVTMVKAELNRHRIPHVPLAYTIPRIWLVRSGISVQEFKRNTIVAALNSRKDTPVLMIHSRNDDFIPPDELDYVLQRVANPVEHLFVDSQGHSSSETDPRFWERVLPFLQQHL